MGRPRKIPENVDNVKNPNPHEEAKAADVAVSEPPKAPEAKDPPKEHSSIGVLIEDDEEKDTSTPEYLSSVVNGFRYFFPVQETRSFSEALQLGSGFIKANLKDGQVFTMNATKMSPFLFLEDGKIVLNPGNPCYTYKQGEVDPMGVNTLVAHVRNGDLVLGDQNVTKIVPKVMAPKVDLTEILSKDITSLREYLKSLLEKRTQITNLGEIICPGVEIKALKEAEQRGQSRKNYLDALDKSLHEIGGMIEYIDSEVVDKELEKKKEEEEKVKEKWNNRAAYGSTGPSDGPSLL